MRAKGRSRSQPNKSSGPQPKAAARSAQPPSRKRPQSSMKRSQRRGGTSPGGLLGSSRANASAHARGAPPSYSTMAARSSWHRSKCQAAGSKFCVSVCPPAKVAKVAKVAARLRFPFRRFSSFSGFSSRPPSFLIFEEGARIELGERGSRHAFTPYNAPHLAAENAVNLPRGDGRKPSVIDQYGDGAVSARPVSDRVRATLIDVRQRHERLVPTCLQPRQQLLRFAKFTAHAACAEQPHGLGRVMLR